VLSGVRLCPLLKVGIIYTIHALSFLAMVFSPTALAVYLMLGKKYQMATQISTDVIFCSFSYQSLINFVFQIAACWLFSFGFPATLYAIS
jgi:hypothetical protein